MLHVKIPNPSKDVVRLLNALTESWGLSEHVAWEDGYEGDDYTGPFIVLVFAKHEERARRVFTPLEKRGWCEVMD